MTLEGTITALITPFRDEPGLEPAVDFETITTLIEWQLQSGINGFVVCGTTGESVTLNSKEKLSIVKHVVDVVKKRVPVIVGTGSNCTKTTIEFTRAVKEVGVDAALVVSPYYNKPTQEGLFEHFQMVTKEGGLPVVVYNIPGRSAVDISIETFKKLSQLSGIIAVKEASGSADKLIDLSESVRARMTLLAGEDSLTYFVMTAGGKGVISAASNVIPKEMVAITDSALAGKYPQALEAQLKALPMIRALFKETNPAPAKAALKILKKIPNERLRLPLVSVREETRELLGKLLR